MDKITILFLSANPRDTNPLKLDEEVREIETKLRASDHRDSVNFVSKWATRPGDLLQLLSQYSPHIVHFSGHGLATEEIMLLDKDGASKPVAKEALVSLFRTLRKNIRLVVLNACYSLSQAKAIASEIDCTIGMSCPISDDAAIIFAASFYRAIGFGCSLKNAFEQGKTALLLEGILEQATPTLMCRGNIDPDSIVLVNPQGPTISAASQPNGLEEQYLSKFRKCTSLDDLLRKALQDVLLISKTDYNQIFLSITDRHSSYLVCVADSVPKHKQRYKVASYEGLLGLALSAGQLINVPNVALDRRYYVAVKETKSELVVPIRNGASALGVINSESEQLAEYDTFKCKNIEAIASALGTLLPVVGWQTTKPPKRLPMIEL